jgi:hypothetical protein
MFVSWFALILFAARALWFHRRVLEDEARLQEMAGEALDPRSLVMLLLRRP